MMAIIAMIPGIPNRTEFSNFDETVDEHAPSMILNF